MMARTMSRRIRYADYIEYLERKLEALREAGSRGDDEFVCQRFTEDGGLTSTVYSSGYGEGSEFFSTSIDWNEAESGTGETFFGYWSEGIERLSESGDGYQSFRLVYSDDQ